MDNSISYKAIFNASKDGVILSDKTGIITIANRQAEALFGYNSEELSGQKIAVLIPKRLQEIHGQLHTQYNIDPKSMEMHSRKELIACRKDGSEFLVEIRLTPIKIENETYNISTIRDLTERKKREQEIEKANERYRGLLDNLDAGIVIHAADTSIINCNGKAAELLGLSEEQMQGKLAIDPEWRFLNEDKSPLPLDRYPVNQVKNTKKPFKSFIGGVNRPKTKDVVWLIVNGFPVLNAKEEIEEIVISFIDITEHRKLAVHINEHQKLEIELTKAKERAEESERSLLLKNNEYEIINNELKKIAKNLQEEISLRQVIERTIPSGLSVVDESGKQIYVNESFCNLIGFSEKELLGNTAPYPYWPTHEYETISSAFQQTLNNKAPKEGFDLVFLHKSGKLIPVQVIVSSFIQEDNKVFWLANVIDITERKVREAEINNKNERIKAIINNTSDVICSIDTDFKLTEFNSVLADTVKDTFGIDLKPGAPMLDYIDPGKREELKSIYKKVLNGEMITNIDNYISHNGKKVFHETNYHPINNINNQIIGISIFSKNITERIKIEQKIKKALKEKEILLAEIHHRIKNNLTIISSLLQLQEINTDNAETKEALAKSRKRIKSTAMVHELLYKSESFSNIYFKEYLTELFNYLRLNENINLNFSGDDIPMEMNTAIPIGLLFNEIILNSFKHSYTPESKGQIEVIMKVEGDFATIDYYDFEGKFPDTVDFNNSNTTGLTLVHTFAEQLNGNIMLLSKTPPKYRIKIKLHENN